MLGTTDGGRTWTPLARNRDFAAVPQFLNDRVGYAISAGGGASGVMAASALVGTTDGGRTWQVLQAIGTTRTGNVGTFALDFLSPAVGFAVLPSLQGCTMGGCLPALEATGDGGETWHTLQPAYQWGSAIMPGWPGAPIFTSPSAGWIALSPAAGPGAGGVLVTQDGGRSFRQFFARRFVAGSLDPIGNGAYAIASPAPPGSGGGQALVRISAQGGVRQVWPAPAPVGGLGEDQGGTLDGIGLPSDAAALLGSGDGGRAWSLLADLPGSYPWLVSFAGKGQGYLLAPSPVSGQAGVLYLTRDGGRHWRRVGQVLAEDPRYARFFAGGAAVAVDYRKSSGAILRSTDGGRSWRRYGSLPAGYTWAVDFTSVARGYAVRRRQRLCASLHHRRRGQALVPAAAAAEHAEERLAGVPDGVRPLGFRRRAALRRRGAIPRDAGRRAQLVRPRPPAGGTAVGDRRAGGGDRPDRDAVRASPHVGRRPRLDICALSFACQRIAFTFAPGGGPHRDGQPRPQRCGAPRPSWRWRREKRQRRRP